MSEQDASSDEVVLAASESPFGIDPATVPSAELHRSFRRLMLLYHLGQQIWAETDANQVFEAIAAAVVQLLNAERAFVAVLEGDQLVPRAVHQSAIEPGVPAWPTSKSLLRRVLQEGVSVLTTDARREAPSAARTWPSSPLWLSTRSWPLRMRASGRR
jgi:GAF domain-containing protein